MARPRKPAAPAAIDSAPAARTSRKRTTAAKPAAGGAPTAAPAALAPVNPRIGLVDQIDAALIASVGHLLDRYTFHTVIDAVWDTSKARFAQAIDRQRQAQAEGEKPHAA